MSPHDIIHSQLLRFYHKFLASEDSARFVESVAAQYTLGTLEKLLVAGAPDLRRAAGLAIGFLGDFDNNEHLGRALCDPDRGVRMVADHGIRQLWFRTGKPAVRAALNRAAWLNRCSKFDQALAWTGQLIDTDSEIAEAWNQQATALAGLHEHESSIAARAEALQLNRFHFLAASGMAGSYLQIDEMQLALDSFRLALTLCPDLENVRSQIGRLERIVGG